MSFDLPIGWKIVPLEDLCERVSVGHVGETSVFFTGTTNGVPLIRSQNVRPTKVDISDIKYITYEFHRQTKKSQLLGGDLLIVRVGQNRGDCAVLPHGLGEMNCANIVFARPDPRYSYYLGAYFNTPKGRDALLSVSSGSAQLVLNTKAVAKIEIPTPPPSTAQAIGAINCTIDNRISLLRETNTTLEAIAQTLFKSWFVDFDPVKAKAEGRLPEGMDEATAALFPSEFEESALGLIPKGWAKLPLYDLATYINGAAYKAFQPNLERRGHPIIKIAELKAGVTEQTAYSDVEMPEKYKISPKDILFSWSGNPDTSIDTFVWSYDSAWLNQHIFRVVPNQPNERTFLLLLLKHLRPVFAELARNKQTTGLGHVTVANLKQLYVICPDQTLLSQFDKVVTPIIEQMFVNQLKIQTLTTLRDILLPRLISGQLRLNQAQEIMDEVGV